MAQLKESGHNNGLQVVIWETQARQGIEYYFNFLVPENEKDSVNIGDYIEKRSGAVWQITGVINVKRSSIKGMLYFYAKAKLITFQR